MHQLRWQHAPSLSWVGVVPLGVAFSPCQYQLIVLGCGRAVKHPFPITASVVLFVMVVVLCGVNWVNERIVHY